MEVGKKGGLKVVVVEEKNPLPRRILMICSVLGSSSLQSIKSSLLQELLTFLSLFWARFLMERASNIILKMKKSVIFRPFIVVGSTKYVPNAPDARKEANFRSIGDTCAFWHSYIHRCAKIKDAAIEYSLRMKEDLVQRSWTHTHLKRVRNPQ